MLLAYLTVNEVFNGCVNDFYKFFIGNQDFFKLIIIDIFIYKHNECYVQFTVIQVFKQNCTHFENNLNLT